MKFKDEAELTQWALSASGLYLFLDYDGTLVDFAPTPDQLDPDPHVIALLQGLVSHSNICVTILSGRRLKDIRILLPIQGLFLAGTYGIELFTPTGETVNRADYDEIRPVLEAIKPKWEQVISGRKGFFLEDKGWTLALHARFADDFDAAQVLALARQVIDLEKLAGLFRILGGHKFLEIAPVLASKKEAVIYLLSRFPISDARCIYIGDDDKDEEAFPAIHECGGAAIKVNQPSQPSASSEVDFIFDSPPSTIRWLEGLRFSS